MQLDTSFSSAVHICVYLDKAGRRVVSSTELAKSLGTNPVVVRRLVGKLKEFGIMKVRAGVSGGYTLGRPAGSITLWDIYLAMRKANPFKLRTGNEDDPVSASLPKALEEALADTEYAMKGPLGRTTIRQIASKVQG